MKWLLALSAIVSSVVAQNCAAVAVTAVPICAQSCIIDGAPSIGCSGTDFACQCESEAALYAAIEGCVSSACPEASFQAVIDGASSVCDCATGGAYPTSNTVIQYPTAATTTAAAAAAGTSVGAGTAPGAGIPTDTGVAVAAAATTSAAEGASPGAGTSAGTGTSAGAGTSAGTGTSAAGAGTSTAGATTAKTTQTVLPVTVNGAMATGVPALGLMGGLAIAVAML